jgi:anti-sigma-K factor RskA
MNSDDQNDGSDFAIAGEYVLGTLPENERWAFERRLTREPGLRAVVDRWEAQFAALAERLPPVEPSPSVWDGIERTLFKPEVVKQEGEKPMWNSIKFWRLSAALGVVAAIVLAVFIVRSPGGTGDSVAQLREFVWVLTDGQKRPNFVVKFDQDRKRVTVIPLDAKAEPGKDMQLWLVPTSGGGAPKSLGLLKPASVTTLGVNEQALGQAIDSGILAVSVEPPGGSTTGAPTGPVILQGSPALVPARP